MPLDAAFINQAAVFTIVLSGFALLTGVYFIRSGNRVNHMRSMLTASALATLFLVLYLTRLALGYEKVFVGPQPWRVPYFALLISHIALAAANVPLALVPLFYAYKGVKAAGSLANIEQVPAARAAFATHRKWVRWTVPVWLYVAVTGWIIYVVLGRWGQVMTQ
ncbi:DUF420 domain-containing protein [Deinococcus sp. Marseille-Q6407]|uniref:DUF420 domain-containing protein n=1 Tax=Deinococcus sp. Marseille-Q6407 TaxID=2969223 RepID=UPI0021BEC9D0|nr:DUF420 domain-containing protein [Deinococcus sp. Marseille-Q6407]